MKGLIINHESNYIDELKNLFDDCDVIHYKKLNENIEIFDGYDYIILSGGSINISGKNDLIEEKKFLKKINKPVLGICLGFEILCVLEGSSLLPLEKKRKGFYKLNFFGKEGKIYHSHSWFIEQLPDCYDVLEKSEKIIELIMHKTKPFLGIQGHPEKSDDFGIHIKNFFLKNFVDGFKEFSKNKHNC